MREGKNPPMTRGMPVTYLETLLFPERKLTSDLTVLEEI
jgi:hypothetical protein